MDLRWFLRHRLEFINKLYDQTTLSFQETVRKINAGEEPFVDTRNPEYDDVIEPMFLIWSELSIPLFIRRCWF